MSSESSHLLNIILPLHESEDQSAWRLAAAKQLRVPKEKIADIRLRKHSIDARQRTIKVQMQVEVSTDGLLPKYVKPQANYSAVSENAKKILIVGCGPAGMFAALKAIELGCKPIILERGKDASARRYDLAPILRKGTVIEDSNYCFGEGGAGTFSDGKLYTRAKKRGPVRQIYETFVAHGAPERILIDAHPHIGSNLLPNVVKAIRKSILKAGGEVHFGTKVNRLIKNAEGKLCGLGTESGQEFLADSVILATGHSARDIYQLLNHEKVRLEQKAFAVGMRIEHPQSLIDEIQYHIPRDKERPRLLPAASYNVATKIRDRGVHSFCMCPGGFIVPCATENDEVVVNGMSLARRDSPFANSGMVVTVEPEDTRAFQAEHGVLAGIAFQKQLEVAAAKAGGGMQKAPGQRVVDFLKNRISDTLPETSYFPGITSAPIHEILPEFIVSRLKEAMPYFNKKKPGYVTEEANFIGFESRTSSPVRIPRNPETLEHVELEGLYPCGEGAGYAGGIVSAALDGLRCAEAACGA